MAQQTTVKYVDDLDGSEADENVTFALDGQSYEIDLSTEHAKALRENLAEYIEVARRVAGRPAKPAKKPQSKRQTSREESAEIREWAAKHDHKVADRGRIPRPVVEAYRAEH